MSSQPCTFCSRSINHSGILYFLTEGYQTLPLLRVYGMINTAVAMYKTRQQLHMSNTLQVDKDVAVAKEHFGLAAPYNAMSPLVLYKGYTRDFLDGKVRSVRLKRAGLDAEAVQSLCRSPRSIHV